jgi:hypothetical protein
MVPQYQDQGTLKSIQQTDGNQKFLTPQFSAEYGCGGSWHINHPE